MFRFIFVILSHSRFICLHRLLISSRKGSALLSGFESSISTTFILAILFFHSRDLMRSEMRALHSQVQSAREGRRLPRPGLDAGRGEREAFGSAVAPALSHPASCRLDDCVLPSLRLTRDQIDAGFSARPGCDEENLNFFQARVHCSHYRHLVTRKAYSEFRLVCERINVIWFLGIPHVGDR